MTCTSKVSDGGPGKEGDKEGSKEGSKEGRMDGTAKGIAGSDSPESGDVKSPGLA